MAGKKLDRANKQAEHVNPSRTGVRTGNPQLDPAGSQVEADPRRKREKPHAPEIDPPRE
jgi:hypothetical protein